MISRTCLGRGASGLSSSSGTAMLAFWISLSRQPVRKTKQKSADGLLHGNCCYGVKQRGAPHPPPQRMCRPGVRSGCTRTSHPRCSLTQNPLHLLASLDLADEAPLEGADTWVELKPEEHGRSGKAAGCCSSQCTCSDEGHGGHLYMVSDQLLTLLIVA